MHISFRSFLANTTQYSDCEDGQIRLVGGQTVNEGNVEICLGNTWSTVCDRHWGTDEADTVCTQLGYQPYG